MFQATSIKMPKLPTLNELKTRACTLEELQLALVQLIELHNGMHNDINVMISQGRIRSSKEAFDDMRYGL